MMYTQLRTVMAERGIPLYVPDENDRLVIDHWDSLHPDTTTDEGKLNLLIRRIYTFDYYYPYTDDAKLYCTWYQAQRGIDWDIRTLVDRDLADRLTAYRGPSHCKDMVNEWPWLKYIYKSSSYKNLLCKGLSELDAVTHLGLVKWVNDLVLKARVAGYAGYVLYATDITQAQKVLNEGVSFDGGYHKLRSVSVSKELFDQCSMLVDILKNAHEFIENHQYSNAWFEVINHPKATFYHVDGLYLMA